MTLPKTATSKGPRETHTYVNVYSQMLLCVCADFSGLPDFRTLTASQIRFFYNGLRADLKARTKTTSK